MGDLKREKEILNTLITDIIPNRFQPRLVFDDESMRELANSIAEHGIIQPLVVRRVADKYEIIAGERRYKAATMAGLQTVPVIVVELNDGESAEVALIENIQRKDLSAIEEAKSYQKVLEMGQLTQEALAKRMGKSQATVANKIRLLNLPLEIQEALNNNDISERHARSLLSLPTPSDQLNMMDRIITERLTVRKTDQEIANLIGGNTTESFINDEPEVEKLDFMEQPATNNFSSFDNTFIAPQQPEPVAYSEYNPTIEYPDLTAAPVIPANIDNLIPEIPGSYPQPIADNPIIPELPSDQQLDNISASAVNSDMMLRPDFNPEPTNFNTTQVQGSTKDYRDEINEIREMVKTFNTNGVTADIEEFDFEQFYQLNIKINKNQT